MKQALAIVTTVLAGCATTPHEQPWTVRDVIDNQRSLDGKTIVVRGWIQSCESLSCPLYNSADEVRKDAPSYWLSIGSDLLFDQATATHVPSYVVIAARVDTKCMNDPTEGTLALCGDRSETLKPLRIIRWE